MAAKTLGPGVIVYARIAERNGTHTAQLVWRVNRSKSGDMVYVE